MWLDFIYFVVPEVVMFNCCSSIFKFVNNSQETQSDNEI